MDAQSDAFANTSLDSLRNLWGRLSASEQFAAEYAVNFLESDGYNIKDLTDDDLESYAWKGCQLVGEGNAEPEYADEDWYEEEADCGKVFDYLVAKRDNDTSYDSITNSTDIIASDGHRRLDDWLLKPGNTWYAVEVFSDDGGASAAGPTVQSDYLVYQAKTPEDAEAIAQKDHYPYSGVGNVRLATPDEIEEMYYYMSEGTCPDCDYDNWSFGGLIDDEEVIE